MTLTTLGSLLVINDEPLDLGDLQRRPKAVSIASMDCSPTFVKRDCVFVTCHVEVGQNVPLVCAERVERNGGQTKRRADRNGA